MHDKSIESYLTEIRRINEELSQENIRMDDALNLYRRGVGLVHEAEQLLSSYQQQIDYFDSPAPGSSGSSAGETA